MPAPYMVRAVMAVMVDMISIICMVLLVFFGVDANVVFVVYD